ncbi:hypothetical protein J5X84_31980 [Streptosporangiaceae bacterium NEAU-GS5]|nr:hypothetical protein [Streptosporangiaceae bacterium NEAU-GS5]
MPSNKDLKRLVRERMAATGELYTQALTHILQEEPLRPLPSPWFLTGSRSDEYEIGLVEQSVVRLRLRAGVEHASGFGALMQSISARRHLGGRVRFAARMRAYEVSTWAGLWLRIDSRDEALALDNMQDRPLRGTADWTLMEIVLEVPEEATSLHFGALLTGPGAIDLTDLELHATDQEITTRESTLPEEPQNLTFQA